MTSLLFEKISLREITVKNRIVVSPMCQYSAADGHVTDWHLVHLGKFAQGGAGIVMMEATAVEKRGRITHGDTGIWEDSQIAGLRRISSFIKEQNAVPAIQLAHAGRKASMARPWYGNGPLTDADLERGDKPWSTVAPNEKSLGEGWIVPRAFRQGDFEVVLNAFRQGARRALAAGFEIVELHAAHGYLLHTFLSPLTNDRTDQYGGSLENRMRFPMEVAKAVRETWPAGKPLFLRISSIDDVEGGWSLEDSIAFTKQLKATGIDVIDCSMGGLMGSATAAVKTTIPRVPGFQLPFAEAVRKETGLKTMAVGLILGAQQAEDALQAGRADLIAIGREVLYDPNWALHAARELGADPDYAHWPQQYGWWLTRRESILKKAGVKR